MAELFYVMFDGYIVTSFEVRTAFRIMQGCWPSDDPKGFDEWIESLKGKTIKEIIPEEDMTVDQIAPIRKVWAVKIYRERTGCSLSEAMAYVDNLLGKDNDASEAAYTTKREEM